MADFKAWFIDAEGFLPQANGAILALGLHRFLVLFFFSPTLICLFYCCWEQTEEGKGI